MSDIIATVTIPEQELLGYKLIKEDHIKCGNCNKKLLTVAKVKESPQKNYFIVKCAYCGDKSFKYLIEGKVYVGAADNLVMARCDTDYPTNQTYISNIEMEKAK